MPVPPEHLPDSLQEVILAVLALDERCGPIVAAQVRAEYFDGQLRDAAAAILRYYARWRRAPGEAQLPAVLSAGRDAQQASSMRQLAEQIVAQGTSLNAGYVVTRTTEWVRSRRLLAAVDAAADRFLDGEDEGVVPEVEAILRGALDSPRSGLDAGMWLNDVRRGMTFLDRAREGYKLGIGPLDDAGIGLFPGEMLLYLAPKNSGKSWFCVHCGRRALLQGAKVVHVTLEMSDVKVVGRYYQSITGAAWKGDDYVLATLEFDDLERLAGWTTKRVRPKMSFSSPGARKWLRSRVEKWGTKLGRLVVKEYPSGSLNMTELRGYLDYLAAAHNFVPHVLIVDYPDLMSLDRRNYRLDMGRLYVELRGLGQERSMAVVAPTQGNRESLSAKHVSASMTSEDVSKNFTADTILTYSQTEKGELQRGLARLKVEYARDAERGQTILMTQSYATGQYCLQAALMRRAHWDKLDEVAGRTEDDDGGPERGSPRARPRRGNKNE